MTADRTTAERTADRTTNLHLDRTDRTDRPADLHREAEPQRAHHAIDLRSRVEQHAPTDEATSRAGERSIDLIVPALNEENRIGDTIRALADEGPFNSWQVTVVVVDNGCIDGTSEVVDAATEGTDLSAEVLGCSRRGKGAAVRYGVDQSTAPYVGYCDADLSTPPSALGQGLALLDAGWDVVIGSRRCIGASYVVPQSRMRRAGSAAFHLAAGRMASAASDTQCGFKLFRRQAARSLLGGGSIDGFAFDVEMLARATDEREFSMIELPVQWQDQSGSSFRPVKDGVRSFVELGRVYGAQRARNRRAQTSR